MDITYEQCPEENALHTQPVSSKQVWLCYQIFRYNCGHCPHWASAGNLQEPMNYFLIEYWAREMRFFFGTTTTTEDATWRSRDWWQCSQQQRKCQAHTNSSSMRKHAYVFFLVTESQIGKWGWSCTEEMASFSIFPLWSNIITIILHVCLIAVFIVWRCDDESLQGWKTTLLLTLVSVTSSLPLKLAC